MIHTSRSKVVSRFQCPRQRYLRYHYGGQGLQRKGRMADAASAGIAIHAGNARVLLGMPVDEAVAITLDEAFPQPAQEGFGQQRMEQRYLIEGSIRAFNRVRVPQLRLLGDIIKVESEHAVQLNEQIVLDFRPDVVIRTEMGLLIVDWKPSPYGGHQWVRGWERNHQVLTYVWATQQIFPDEPVLGIKIEGYVKGKRKWDNNFRRKIQQTPLCYVYENSYNGNIVPDYQRTDGWDKVALWDTSFTSQEWVEEVLTPEQVEGHFLSPVPEICPTPQELERWHRQTSAGEKATEEAAKHVEFYRSHWDYETFVNAMDTEFPQHHDTCFKYGEDYPCEFDGLCHNEQVQQDPYDNGFEERVDHHAQEEEE